MAKTSVREGKNCRGKKSKSQHTSRGSGGEREAISGRERPPPLLKGGSRKGTNICSKSKGRFGERGKSVRSARGEKATPSTIPSKTRFQGGVLSGRLTIRERGKPIVRGRKRRVGGGAKENSEFPRLKRKGKRTDMTRETSLFRLPERVKGGE